MVAFLKKPSGSEGFQEMVDFLNGSHIRYALTKNPTIYVSLIKQFWQTATVRAVDNRQQQIIATVDGKEFTFTEASVRRHLQFANADGGSPMCQETTRVPLLIPGIDSSMYNIVRQSSSFGNRLKADKESIWYCLYQAYHECKELEKIIKSNQARKRTKILVSDDEEDSKDSSKHVRMIEEIDQET
nr:xylulose kinase-1 [Tanacetum cinerariifolium]